MRFGSGTARLWLTAASAVVVATAIAGAQGDKKAKPSITVRATPITGFAPVRVDATAMLQGGADDFQDFYCPAIEWEWGDGTRSESKMDCDPYEAGKSEIRRTYRADHRYEFGGEFRVLFRLKQKNKTVGSGSITVTIKGGIRDGF